MFFILFLQLAKFNAIDTIREPIMAPTLVHVETEEGTILDHGTIVLQTPESEKQDVRTPPSAPIGSIQQCPIAWYINKQPGYNIREEYLIYPEGNRKPYEVDISWVKANCDITTPTIIQ